MPITLDGTTGIDAPLGTAATPSYGNTTATTTGLYFPTSTTLGLSTNGTAALTIDASQNVGIGTSSPSTKLEVSGGITASGGNVIKATAGVNIDRSGNDAYLLLQQSTAGGGQIRSIAAGGFKFTDNGAATEWMRIDSSGNVGIGTTSPSSYGKLAISNGTVVLTNNVDTANGYFGTSTNHPLQIFTNNAIRMYFDTSGNVGIGTSSPSAKLSVVGTSYFQTAGGAGNYGTNTNFYSGGGDIALAIGTNSGGYAYQTVTTNHALTFGTNNTERMRITSAGGVSFGSSGTAYGTSGQVLTSAGNAPPTWTTISTSASGTLIRAPQILTSGTSYTTPSNCTKIYVELVGGGGGGGGVNSGNQFGGFGGGGAYLNAYVTVTGSTAYTIAVGSGGAKGVASAGSAGGTTSIIIGATTYSAGGGGGGALSSGSNAAGGAGGTATNGNFNFNGIAGSTGGAGGIGGSPPSAFYNPSAAGTVSLGSGVGSNATYYGCGGGCAYTAGGSAGNGYQGVICIWEYT